MARKKSKSKRPRRRPTARRRPPAARRARAISADVKRARENTDTLLLGEQKPILLRLPSPLLERIRELAQADRRSINRWCEHALATAAAAA